jgi:hypothetical protein
MAKGHGHNRKKDTRRARAAKRAAGTVAPTSVQPLQAPAMPRARGLEATRGPVSNAYRAWVADYGRRQAAAVAAQFDGGPVPADLFLLAPLTTRTVEAPGGEIVSVQMGLPLVATRAGGVAVAPDRLAIAALRLAEDDARGAMAQLGFGHAPDLPPPDLLFAAQLPGEGMRGARAADALAWYLARAVEEGDVQLEARDLAAAAAEALALLRPNVAPREAARLDPAALADYEGYGDGADERPVPLDITAPPARGGLTGLPGGAYLHDDGTPLAPLLADLRDYVIGLWPYDYFGLETLTADAAAEGKGRGVTLAALADLVRRLDDVLAQGAEAVEEALAAEGQPPAWIAEETASYREARQALRETRTAQELLPRLGPILFDLEIPPADYAPQTLDDEE